MKLPRTILSRPSRSLVKMESKSSWFLTGSMLVKSIRLQGTGRSFPADAVARILRRRRSISSLIISLPRTRWIRILHLVSISRLRNHAFHRPCWATMSSESHSWRTLLWNTLTPTTSPWTLIRIWRISSRWSSHSLPWAVSMHRRRTSTRPTHLARQDLTVAMKVKTSSVTE